jgi:hypothetical protein
MPGLLFLCQDLLSKGVESANMKGFFMCWELGIGTWFQCGELYAYKVGLVLVASTTSKSKV